MINYIIRRILKVSYTKVKISVRGFYSGDPISVSQLETIGKNFLNGYHNAIADRNSHFFENSTLGVQREFSGFYFEGVAMGNSIKDSLSFFNKYRLKKLMDHPIGNAHIYMLHVGIGWAFARIPGNIEKKMKKYHPLYRWLIMDGYGFHQAYFKTKKYVYGLKKPTGFKNTYSLHAFYQGVGRCLWFVECAVPERIAERIEAFPPEFRKDLWSGAGLACTYACGVSLTEIIKLKNFSDKYYPHFAQGAVFAAKARQRANITTDENEKACTTICSLSISEAAALSDRCFEEIPEGLLPEEQYEYWRSTISSAFIKTRQYEPAN